MHRSYIHFHIVPVELAALDIFPVSILWCYFRIYIHGVLYNITQRKELQKINICITCKILDARKIVATSANITMQISFGIFITQFVMSAPVGLVLDTVY